VGTTSQFMPMKRMSPSGMSSTSLSRKPTTSALTGSAVWGVLMRHSSPTQTLGTTALTIRPTTSVTRPRTSTSGDSSRSRKYFEKSIGAVRSLMGHPCR